MTHLKGTPLLLAGAILAVSNFMVILDTSIANVSVPHIAGSLGIAPDQGTWVITSYSVADAITVPLTGWLAQRFGTVRTYIFAMVGFGLFSILCGLSWSLGMLVACRIGQGLCGGPIIPLTQTLLRRVFPPSQEGMALGLWGMTTVVGPVAGPVLGGIISDNASWHWIFFINIPIVLLCIFGAASMLRGAETRRKIVRIDAIGLALLVLWVGSLQLMLDLGRDRDWFASSFIVGLAIVAAIGFAVFVVWELTARSPVVDIRIFRHRGLAFSAIIMALTFGTYFSTVVVVPQFLQGGLGYTAEWAGYTMMWQGVLAIVASPIVGKLSAKIDPRAIVAFGVGVMALGCFMRTGWTTGAGYWDFAIPLLVTGLGVPCFFVPLSILSLGGVRPEETASAAGLVNFMRTLAGAVGTSIATTLWTNRQQGNRAELAGTLQPPQDLAAAGAQQGLSAEQIRSLLSRLVDQETTTLATIQLFEVAAALLVLAGLLVWLVPRPKRKVAAAAH